MPEGDTVHAAGRRIGGALVGKEIVSVETPQRRQALLDQRNVAGIGNVWEAEGCFDAGIDPWRPVADVSDEGIVRVLRGTRARMQDSVSRGGHIRGLQVYDRSGRPCRRCNTRIRARGQGDDNRTTYRCPGCQR